MQQPREVHQPCTERRASTAAAAGTAAAAEETAEAVAGGFSGDEREETSICGGATAEVAGAEALETAAYCESSIASLLKRCKGGARSVDIYMTLLAILLQCHVPLAASTFFCNVTSLLSYRYFRKHASSVNAPLGCTTVAVQLD